MDKTIESLLLKYRELTRGEKRLTDEERERFKNINYNRIYNHLLGLFDEKFNNNHMKIKIINPSTGEVFYERDHLSGRFNMTSLGYKLKMNKHGVEIYTVKPALFEKREQPS